MPPAQSSLQLAQHQLGQFGAKLCLHSAQINLRIRLGDGALYQAQRQLHIAAPLLQTEWKIEPGAPGGDIRLPDAGKQLAAPTVTRGKAVAIKIAVCLDRCREFGWRGGTQGESMVIKEVVDGQFDLFECNGWRSAHLVLPHDTPLPHHDLRLMQQPICRACIGDH